MLRLKRSPRELAYRLRQEIANLALWLRPPSLPSSALSASPLAGLPDPVSVADQLRRTAFARDVHRRAADILAHNIPLFDVSIHAGEEIHWRRDYRSGKETGLVYFRRVPYLDAAAAGDHKVIWEVSRHHHLVLLAQAALLEESEVYLEEIWAQLESWIGANPFHCGINWASALEVGLRALSWIWIFHLAGERMPARLQAPFFETLYRHGRHLAVNLSFYFSPNTHLLGEAVALHALGVLFPDFPGARNWAQAGAQVVQEQMRRQVRPDGGHFEQSTYYHVYALDMFLFHAVLAAPSAQYRDGLARMAGYLDALLGPSRTLPAIGDDDGGRFFHPFGARDQFGRATLAACAQFLGRSEWTYCTEDLHPLAAWWLGEAEGQGGGELPSQFFPDTGIAVMTAGPHHVVVDAGPFGPWGAGHSHSDTLSLVVRSAGEQILIDPGAYTYVADPEWRNRFRGSAAHNTVRVDGIDQAVPAGPFRWIEHPTVSVRSWITTPEYDELDAECRYRDIVHRRRVRFLKAGLLLIIDEIDGPPGEHEVEQFWHLGSESARARLVLERPVSQCDGWRSLVFGQKQPAPAICVRRKTRLPLCLAAGVLLEAGSLLNIEHVASGVRFHWQRPGSGTVTITL